MLLTGWQHSAFPLLVVATVLVAGYWYLRAPLLALGAPVTLLLQTSSRRVNQLAHRFLDCWPFVAISHPVPVWFR